MEATLATLQPIANRIVAHDPPAGISFVRLALVCAALHDVAFETAALAERLVRGTYGALVGLAAGAAGVYFAHRTLCLVERFVDRQLHAPSYYQEK